MRVLVVCSGNICRSPMVAECLRHRAGLVGPEDLVVDSAGTLGIDGARASAEAVQAVREIGLDLTGHRSRGIVADDLRRADFVIAMTREHLSELESRFPDGTDRRYVIRAFETGPSVNASASDLDDPIGEPVAVYRAQLQIIERCVGHLADHLKQAG